MHRHLSFCGFLVPRFQCLQHPGVLLERLAGAFGHQPQRPERRISPEQRYVLEKDRPTRLGINLHMEFAIRFLEKLEVISADGGVHGVQQVVQPSQLYTIDVRDRQTGRHRLQHAPKPVHLLYVRKFQLGDVKAMVRFAHYQALALEDLQSLPNRRDAQPELTLKLPEHQPAPGRQLAGVDRLPDRGSCSACLGLVSAGRNLPLAHLWPFHGS
jgi:hypothetical protein